MEITGTLTRDAVVKETKSGKEFVLFSVAVDSSYYNRAAGKRVDRTTYYTGFYWITTKVAERMTKGRVLKMVGEPAASCYQGNDGKWRGTLNFNADEIRLLGKPAATPPNKPNQPGDKTDKITKRQTMEPETVPADAVDDLPF
ncbi:single-strand DNA-binding protein [Chitinophaga terrae (ex Kim and Jung 2007)]|uniref:single-stranded DNA-binding protein n=1 Tax=Chitinophaga terrae (ex Kim and Jung 2007) TaxID=408074 RepID=UPI0027837EB1|nr:single-stranded DNA-binding protein [Chitinophaga terrae (ex Kim and Jung 2007)]MDQ0107476.1 single-strand DNA-binding protein [Chitinophaga terrae (ex Kim and Jung 2007)]